MREVGRSDIGKSVQFALIFARAASRQNYLRSYQTFVWQKRGSGEVRLNPRDARADLTVACTAAVPCGVNSVGASTSLDSGIANSRYDTAMNGRATCAVLTVCILNVVIR
jgi:hypothetical protein